MADRTGERLGQYRLVCLIGRGGFAEVYLGEHVSLGTQAAVKVLYTRLSNPVDAVNFEKEARTIAHLNHPHIVRVLDYDIKDDTPFLVMDYAPGGTLRQRHPKGTRLPLDTVVSYTKQVAEALHYAHQKKFIHRDIKPENMLLGENHQVLLSDFGIALVAQSTRYQKTQEIVGTAAYMAPEQLQGKPRQASDQYALGIVVYEWLCGDRPFHGSFTEIYSQHMFASPPPLHEKISTISSDVEQVIFTALAKEPTQRFVDVQAFTRALEAASLPTISRTIFPSILLAETNPLLRPVQKGTPLDQSFRANHVTAQSRASELSKWGISRREVLIGFGGLIVGGTVWTTLTNLLRAKPATVSHHDGRWDTTGNLLLGRRTTFRATTLKNGKVLVEGGRDPNGFITTESEIFDPATSVWTKTKGMVNVGRDQHSATLLLDGRVLITGGWGDQGRDSAELYDPATDIWTLTNKMSQVRTRHTATLLPNGKVLIVGGCQAQPLNSAELYDPSTGTWSSAGTMLTPRSDHVAILLPNGKVLVAGGSLVNDGNTSTSKAELYDPNANMWTPTSSMNMLRAYFTAVLLPTGNVLAIGGRTLVNGDSGDTTTTELYDPTTERWSLIASMQYPRENTLGQDAQMLTDGTVLVVGGDTLGTSEIYSPSINKWNTLLGPGHSHYYGACTLLNDGRVLIAGGYDLTLSSPSGPNIYTLVNIFTPDGTTSR